MCFLHLRRTGATLLTALLILVFATVICTASSAGFVMDDLGTEDSRRISQQMVFATTRNEVVKTRFNCFAVHENGNIVLGFEKFGSSTGHTISLYNSVGQFVRGITFKTSSSFDLDWNGDDILIYLTRSNLAIQIDQQGNFIEAKQIPDTADNRNYWNRIVRSNKRIVNETIYIAEGIPNSNSIVQWGSYSRLIKVLPNGTKTVFYESGSSLPMSIPLGVGFFLAVLATIVLRIWRKYKLSQK